MIERQSTPEVLGKRQPIAFASEDGSRRLGYYCDSGKVHLGEDFTDGNNRISSGRSLIITNDQGIARPYLVANRYIIDVQQTVARDYLYLHELELPPLNRLDLVIGQEFTKGRVRLPKVVGFFVDGKQTAHNENILTISDPFKEIEETLQPYWDKVGLHIRNRLSLKGNLRSTSIGNGLIKVKEEYL